MRTVYPKNLKPGMIIKCGFIVLENVKVKDDLNGSNKITFLTKNCTVYTSKVGDLWDYEVFI